MAKVLISFLGTGSLEDKASRKYTKVKYKIENISYETSFVSQAIAKHFKTDKKIILGTAKSMWEEYYQQFHSGNSGYDEELAIELYEYAENSNSKTDNFSIFERLNEKLSDSTAIILKYGLNDEELRYNMTRIFEIEDLLNDGDELYVDITHGFRSFPVFANQIIFYLKEISRKNIKIDSLFYGNLEVSGELGYAPVTNISLTLELNDWLIAASVFKDSANSEKLVRLIGQNSKKNSIILDDFSNAIRLNYAHSIRKEISNLNALHVSDYSGPEKLILESVINDFTERFVETDSTFIFQYKLAKWYLERKFYSSAALLITESIVSYLVEIFYGIDKVFEKTSRVEILRDKNCKIIYRDVFKTHSNVARIRNNIAHNRDRDEDLPKTDIKELKDLFPLVKKHLEI
jgi:CRISPR-associated Csx2 family protein